MTSDVILLKTYTRCELSPTRRKETSTRGHHEVGFQPQNLTEQFEQLGSACLVIQLEGRANVRREER